MLDFSSQPVEAVGARRYLLGAFRKDAGVTRFAVDQPYGIQQAGLFRHFFGFRCKRPIEITGNDGVARTMDGHVGKLLCGFENDFGKIFLDLTHAVRGLVIYDHILDHAHTRTAIGAGAGAGFVNLRGRVANFRIIQSAFHVFIRKRIAHADIHCR